MGLLRYQLFSAYAVAILSVWWTGLQAKSNFELAKPLHLLIDYLPLWILVIVGIYLLGLLAIGVVNCKDRPEAAAELELQVTKAKSELRQQGIIQ